MSFQTDTKDSFEPVRDEYFKGDEHVKDYQAFASTSTR